MKTILYRDFSQKLVYLSIFFYLFMFFATPLFVNIDEEIILIIRSLSICVIVLVYIIELVIKEWTTRELLSFIIMVVFSIILKQPSLLMVYCLYQVCRDHYFMRFSFKMYLMFVLIVMLLGVLNVNGFVYSQGIRPRLSLGFENPNQASIVLYGLLILWLITYRQVYNLYSTLFSIVIMLLIFFSTDSRSLIFGILPICYYVIVYKMKRYKLFKWVGYVFIICTLATIGMALFTNPVLQKISSGRTLNWSNYLNQFGVTFLGFPNVYKEVKVPIDNTYIYLLINNGILGYVFCLYFVFKICRKMDNKINTFVVISMFLYGLFEVILFAPFNMLIWLLLQSVEMKRVV